jgi:hypothetical protein
LPFFPCHLASRPDSTSFLSPKLPRFAPIKNELTNPLPLAVSIVESRYGPIHSPPTLRAPYETSTSSLDLSRKPIRTSGHLQLHYVHTNIPYSPNQDSLALVGRQERPRQHAGFHQFTCCTTPRQPHRLIAAQNTCLHML